MLRPRGTRFGLQAISVALTGGTVSVTPARFAFKTSRRGTLILGILNVMKPFAAGLASGQAATQISASINRLKMIRIYALTAPTKMIKIGSLWRYALGADVEGTVSQLRIKFGTTEFAVPIGIQGSIPDPTSILNGEPNPIVEAKVSGGAGALLSRVVLGAHIFTQATRNTFFITHRTLIHGTHLTPSEA